MIPLRIALKGFMSYREEQVLSFDGASLWILAGRNGAGKSAIFDAITYALYGCYRGKSREARQLINHHADALEVEFDFLVDGRAYRIRRTLSRRGRSTWEAHEILPAEPSPSPSPSAKGRLVPIEDTDSSKGLERFVDKVLHLRYEAFTSSILLQQGQSEKLLLCEPKDRHKILTEIIDLSPYQKLSARADLKRRSCEDELKLLTGELRYIREVTDEELAAAEAALQASTGAHQKLEAEEEQLAGRLNHARDWERLSGELGRVQAQEQADLVLLSRAAEIEEGLARYRELEHGARVLEGIVQQRARLAEQGRRIGQLQKEMGELPERLGLAERRREELLSRTAGLRGEVERLRGELAEVMRRLAEVTPLLGRLEAIEQAERRVQGLTFQLIDFPGDLAEQVKKAEAEARKLEEVERALPWLSHFVAGRAELQAVQRRRDEGAAALLTVVTQVEVTGKRREGLAGRLRAAEEAERQLLQQAAAAQARRDAARSRHEAFQQAAQAPTCELCGQVITKEHARGEAGRLAAALRAAEEELSGLNKRSEAQREERRRAEQELRAAEAHLAELQQKKAQGEAQLEQAGRDAQALSERLRHALAQLPAGYRRRILPSPEMGWLETTHPGDGDMARLRTEVKRRRDQEEKLQAVKRRQGEFQVLDGQRQEARRQLDELMKGCSREDAEKARREAEGLKARQAAVTREHADKGRALGELEGELGKAEKEAGALHKALEADRRNLEVLQATRAEMEHHLRAALAALPEGLREIGERAGDDELGRLRGERDRLAVYQGLGADLLRARRDQAGLEDKSAELSALLAEVPEAARRPARLLEEEHRRLREARKELEKRLLGERTELQRLTEGRKARQKLEEKFQATEKRYAAHKILSELLGREGLQMYLLRQAEEGIVRLANEVLGNLSQGRMRLKLKEQSDTTKALDLLVYNDETGTEPTDVTLASGSQRFRIAISLALGIGRYAGHEARRIESVIIDEGFGCLDKNSRDDTVQALRDLKQELQRIILVSHQEEFTSAFSNGYEIRLENMSSVSSPI